MGEGFRAAKNFSTGAVNCGKKSVHNCLWTNFDWDPVENRKFIHNPLWMGIPWAAWVCGGFPHKIPLLLLLLKRILSLYKRDRKKNLTRSLPCG